MSSNSLAALRKFAAQALSPEAKVPPPEYCELCCMPLRPEHRHLLEMAKRQIVCACDPCAMRFEGVIEGRFKIIPRDVRPLPDFQMSDAEWDNLALPIKLAFFFHSTPLGKMMAMYPSPAGATESLLPLTAWETLAEHNPELRALEPDVEALLINRVREKRESFIVPIDKCFALVGTIRMHWRGFSGGEEVWREIDEFFASLRT